MPAKVVVKSGYIKNVRHMRNSLEYAGTKIEAQLAVLSDGSAVELGAVDKLSDSDEVQTVRVRIAGGKTRELTPERYANRVRETARVQSEEVIVWEGGEKTFDSAEYLKYIAYRPSVVAAIGKKHGLFNLDGDAEIDTEKQKISRYGDCLMWSHIISIDRADAERTGFDRRAAWQNLVTAKSQEISKLYNIDPKNLQLNAAYHDKDHHPHIHLFFYSTDPREGIVRDMKTASERLKSLFFNEIFKDDVSYLKAVHYDQREQLDERLRGMLKGINRQSYRPPQEVCDKLLALSVELRDVKGKLAYAYQSPAVKQKIDALVTLMVERDPHLREIFGAYRETQREFVEQYNEDPEKIEKRMQEFDRHFFHPRAAERGKPGSGDRAVLHNEVLRFAATLSEAVLLPPADDAPVIDLPPTAPTGDVPKSEPPARGGATAQKEIVFPELKTTPLHSSTSSTVSLYPAVEDLRSGLFAGLLTTLEKRSPQHQKMLALHKKLSYIEEGTAYDKLPDEVRAQLTEVVGALLKKLPAAKEHAAVLEKLTAPAENAPRTFVNMTADFARNYQQYLKQNIRFKARYTAQLLMRASARRLAAMARENDSYNNREGDGKSNITKWNNLKEQYHNFTEPEPIHF